MAERLHVSLSGSVGALIRVATKNRGARDLRRVGCGLADSSTGYLSLSRGCRLGTVLGSAERSLPMLVDEIKTRMFQAIKAKRTVEKEILRVALGEIQTAAIRSEKDATDESSVQVLRKLIKSAHESIKLTEDEGSRADSQEEIEILSGFLPKSWDVGQIVAALESVASAVREAEKPGQAIGVAMKHLKAQSAPVSGQDVAVAVQQIRSAG